MNKRPIIAGSFHGLIIVPFYPGGILGPMTLRIVGKA
jgi:hypothetical protein